MPVVSGTLDVQAVGNARRYTLTDKVDGKTRCLYVPVSMEAKVRRYAENWRELKSIMLGILCRRTTRNKMDGDRNDPAYALNLLRLSQQKDWVGGEDGFGLEHTFCKDEHTSRAAHMLMQLAHNLWQVFESGHLR